MKLSASSLLIIACLNILASCGNNAPATSHLRSVTESKPASKPIENTTQVADDQYLQQSEADAGASADRAGIPWRVIERDGKSLPATMDFNPKRLNFSIKDHQIIRVTRG